MKIVCIGDSLTFGYGVPRKNCWVELIKNKLNIDIFNKGINGDTTTGMLSRSYKDILQLSPTHVIILGGDNDFLGGRSLELVERNIEELVKEAIQSNIVPIIGIQPPIDTYIAEKKWSNSINYNIVNTNIKDYRQWILSFTAANNLNSIDFYDCFIKSLELVDSKDIYIDGLHPTVLGHKLMADCVINTFNEKRIL
ncbi:GDSL-type esterase/lipase family protein [Clostridium sp. DJ247]|uniref:GDSL-type esterase/lipase family protein n=1 Tax=Clostridium sp. DJ247 TaxID=2726188 RepID=UPI00162332DE|nr:GDSL-type esterase/lipase family protein [Clostridium sp. DJ247]MBC2579216.1 hydrolase [Clostridium sp. DJ247]MBC2579333.1 hydrolase [Clostridium sp. DJ247]